MYNIKKYVFIRGDEDLQKKRLEDYCPTSIELINLRYERLDGEDKEKEMFKNLIEEMDEFPEEIREKMLKNMMKHTLYGIQKVDGLILKKGSLRSI